MGFFRFCRVRGLTPFGTRRSSADGVGGEALSISYGSGLKHARSRGRPANLLLRNPAAAACCTWSQLILSPSSPLVERLGFGNGRQGCVLTRKAENLEIFCGDQAWNVAACSAKYFEIVGFSLGLDAHCRTHTIDQWRRGSDSLERITK